jgi:hypothetical protein
MMVAGDLLLVFADDGRLTALRAPALDAH